MLKVTAGWVKEQSDIPIKSGACNMMGTLRFSHPTTQLDTVGRVKEQRDVPVITPLQERIMSAMRYQP